MSAQRDAETAGMLRAASAEYDDLPQPVADRLDRVLEQLPTADTLHSGDEARALSWRERLRTPRVRYALVSAAAALLVTVGAVATAVQVVSQAGESTDGGAVAEQDAIGNSGGAPTHEDSGAAPEADDFAADEETQAESTEGIDGTGSVETFATGTDYSETTDLLTALRELGDGSPVGTVPEELTGLAQGGMLWANCQKAIAEQYDSLIVAADFARFNAEPAVMALLVSESGETAVAVTPECANGTVEELFAQK